MDKFFLEICNNGKTVYSSDQDGNGSRIIGGKVWGFIKPQAKIELTEENCDILLAELRSVKKQIAKQKRRIN